MNAPPRLLGGRYEVGDVLGRGGMAEVHLGRDTRLGRAVAIKMLRSDLARDPSFQARFRREAQSAAALNHPAVVAVYDSGEEPTDGGAGVPVPYIVMEYVEGRTLRELLTRGQTLPWTEALRITSGVLAALGYSHRAGIVHRDIKPANVMLTPTGDVKVMDFGIARAMADASATMTQTQAVIGTAQYLSPEQARGETVDARSDLYSAGCLLYELVAGRPPFVADSPVAVAYQHVGEPPQPPSAHNPQVPHPVDAIVVHALVKDKNGRYQSAEEFKADTDAALAGQPVSAAALGSIVALGSGVAAAAATQAMSTLGTGAVTAAAGATGTQATGTQAMSTAAIAAAADAQALSPATEAALGGASPVAPVTVTRRVVREDPDRPNRTGVWVLLALLAAALLALGVLVLPSLISKGPPPPATVQVANVLNQPKDGAAAALTRQQLKVAFRGDVSPDVPAGRVMLQTPTASTTVRTGSTVTLVISTGPGTVAVPDVVGQTQTDAERILRGENLKLGKVTLVDSTEQAKGRVISSDPQASATLAPKSLVSVRIASGQVKVPNVSGQSLADATRQLTDAKLAVDGTADYVVSTQPAGSVIDQSAPAGQAVEVGTRIRLTIAKAAPVITPTVTPTLTPPPTQTSTPTLTPTDTGTPTVPPVDPSATTPPPP